MTGRRSHGRLSALNGVVHQGTLTPLPPIHVLRVEPASDLETCHPPHHESSDDVGCFRHQLLLPRPYLVLTKSLRLDIQCQRAASVKIGWKYLDD